MAGVKGRSGRLPKREQWKKVATESEALALGLSWLIKRLNDDIPTKEEIESGESINLSARDKDRIAAVLVNKFGKSVVETQVKNLDPKQREGLITAYETLLRN